MNAKVKRVEEALAEVPVLDIHTHLVGGRLGARGLHDVLLYHMVISDLYAAGCPSGARLTQYPGWPDAGGGPRAPRAGAAVPAGHPEHELLLGRAPDPARPLRLEGAGHGRHPGASWTP